MPDTLLVELARETLELSESPLHAARRKMWVGLHSLCPPRNLASYGMYTHVWERDIAEPSLFYHKGGLARHLETVLRARLWKAKNIPDDEPLATTIILGTPHPPGEKRLWGVKTENIRPRGIGSYKPAPPIVAESGIEALRLPPYEEDASAKCALEEQAHELLDGLLPVKFQSDELHFGPFEWLVRLRGMDAVLLDVYDRPGFVHQLMDIVTTGITRYHQAREAAGAVDTETSWGFHMYYDDIPDGFQKKLKGCWAYIHAQSSASLSPAMYAEFVQPYNERLAALFYKVYYHGCEDLSAKCGIIRCLPNLRLFHVSPWTSVRSIVEKLGASCALEVHSHPTNVLFAWTKKQIRNDLKRLHEQAEPSPHTLKLCDVETVPDRGEKLRIWAELAREVVESG